MDALNQWIQDLLTPLGWSGQAAVRLCLAAVLGGVIGIEREMRGREAGFRTNLLVCLGSALVMLVSTKLADLRWTPTDAYVINVDPGRIAYGVMTGIGFLGAGAIMRHQHTVRGLTTAAAMWCVAALGLAVGIGEYTLAILAAVLVVAALWLLNVAEDRLPSLRHRRILIRCPWDEACVSDLVGRFKAAGLDVVDQSFHRLGDLTHAEIEFSVAFTDVRKYDAIVAELHNDTKCVLLASDRI